MGGCVCVGGVHFPLPLCCVCPATGRRVDADTPQAAWGDACMAPAGAAAHDDMRASRALPAARRAMQLWFGGLHDRHSPARDTECMRTTLRTPRAQARRLAWLAHGEPAADLDDLGDGLARGTGVLCGGRGGGGGGGNDTRYRWIQGSGNGAWCSVVKKGRVRPGHRGALGEECVWGAGAVWARSGHVLWRLRLMSGGAGTIGQSWCGLCT